MTQQQLYQILIGKTAAQQVVVFRDAMNLQRAIGRSLYWENYPTDPNEIWGGFGWFLQAPGLGPYWICSQDLYQPSNTYWLPGSVITSEKFIGFTPPPDTAMWFFDEADPSELTVYIRYSKDGRFVRLAANQMQLVANQADAGTFAAYFPAGSP